MARGLCAGLPGLHISTGDTEREVDEGENFAASRRTSTLCRRGGCRREQAAVRAAGDGVVFAGLCFAFLFPPSLSRTTVCTFNTGRPGKASLLTWPFHEELHQPSFSVSLCRSGSDGTQRCRSNWSTYFSYWGCLWRKGFLISLSQQPGCWQRGPHRPLVVSIFSCCHNNTCVLCACVKHV